MYIFVGQHNKITSKGSQYIFNIEKAQYFILKLQYIEFAAIGFFIHNHLKLCLLLWMSRRYLYRAENILSCKFT